MPKRSLNPGNGGGRRTIYVTIEQLNKAVETMLSRTDRTVGKGKIGQRKIGKGKIGKFEAAIEVLVRLAADLRDLPRDEFQGAIEVRIQEGRRSMATVAEPVTASRMSASPEVDFRILPRQSSSTSEPWAPRK